MRWEALAKCRVCGEKGTVNIPSANMYLCEKHFTEYILRKVERTINKYKMISENEKIIIGVSGGKDSMALLHILSKINEKNKKHAELIPVYIDLGIPNYSYNGKIIVEKESKRLGLNPVIIELKELLANDLFSLSKKVGRPICSVCGLIKRYVLNAIGVELDGAVATGHNLDDMMAYALKEFMMVNTTMLSKLYPINHKVPGAAKRIKPLFFVYERELLIYDIINDISFNTTKCPYRKNMGLEEQLKRQMLFLEEEHPSISSGFFSKLFKNNMFYTTNRDNVETKTCKACGLISSGEYCSFCRMGKKLANANLGIEVRSKIRNILADNGLLSIQ